MPARAARGQPAASSTYARARTRSKCKQLLRREPAAAAVPPPATSNTSTRLRPSCSGPRDHHRVVLAPVPARWKLRPTASIRAVHRHRQVPRPARAPPTRSPAICVGTIPRAPPHVPKLGPAARCLPAAGAWPPRSSAGRRPSRRAVGPDARVEPPVARSRAPAAGGARPAAGAPPSARPDIRTTALKSRVVEAHRPPPAHGAAERGPAVGPVAEPARSRRPRSWESRRACGHTPALTRPRRWPGA